MKTTQAVFVAISALALAGAGFAPGASAQTAATQAAVKAATMKLASAGAVSASARGWTCATEGSYEIAPVSSDVESGSTSYVLVHLRRGEPVSSERISASDVAALKKLGCSLNERGLDGEAFVGG